MSVTENITSILNELENTKLICVTKTVNPERINEAIRAGATIIGENRVQEFEEKADSLLQCKKHMIGHLQTNKVKKAVEYFDVIQSVDSLKVAREIDKRARDAGIIQEVYIQVNIGNEPQKYGFKPDVIKKGIDEISSLKNIHVTGMMCIPPYVPPEQARPYFKEMKALFHDLLLETQRNDNIDLKELSMGMSGDYRVAIEEGATIVRIGSAIFGKRKY
ncbi:YggS family pyridoxal phosphate-dependent enzyme [Methanolobus bombayensis]|uniref:YggS family pyridoxal phosphate-dependent enzyme n=1 Tax=Methanolobus bombayensis TaxID=38023 RepID=UPI001AE53CAF|nr:YggS family pyridoxal phosphate-dependent enzyme [Methanolobus bombayensis]MBP1908479.1 pyridoxal phosphate enzyme (YggS family) [Methanolobus bombayensis]